MHYTFPSHASLIHGGGARGVLLATILLMGNVFDTPPGLKIRAGFKILFGSWSLFLPPLGTSCVGYLLMVYPIAELGLNGLCMRGSLPDFLPALVFAFAPMNLTIRKSLLRHCGAQMDVPSVAVSSDTNGAK